MSDRKTHIDSILESLDGIQRATPGPFFFTRLQARMRQEERGFGLGLVRLITRPAIAITGICLVVVINTWVIITRSGAIGSGQQHTELALSEEYALSSNILYYYDGNSEVQ